MEKIKIHFIVDITEQAAQFVPSFGVAYLSAFIKKHLPDVQVSLSFLSDAVLADIARIKPDIVAFSSTSRYFEQLRAISDEVKVKFNLPIVWGGVHVSLAPDDLPVSADVGVIGEGEETLVQLLTNFKNGAFDRLESVQGIAYRINGTLITTMRRPFIEPLDSIPPPDLGLFRVAWGPNHRAVIMTSRGCPYKCRFCASSLFWERARLYTPEYVVAEIKKLVNEYHVRELLIYDDFFSINRKRVARIAELMQTEPLLRKLRFECLSRVDNFNEDMAQQLKAMGVYRISFGIESGCQKTLDYLKNKTISLGQVEQAIGIAKKYGFECVGSFIIGSPYETAEDIEEALSFIEKLHLDGIQITIITPFPGTPLWEDGKAVGKIVDNKWSDKYYVLLGWEECFSLFAGGIRAKIDEFLRNKVLMTQIDRDVFIKLVERAVRLQIKTNVRLRHILILLIKKIMPQRGIQAILQVERSVLQRLRRR